MSKLKYMSVLRIILTSLLIVYNSHALSPVGFAPSRCASQSNSQFENTEDISQYIHETADIDNPDRRSDEEYAKEHSEPVETIRHRYAASGDFDCLNSDSEAQLVIRNDIILVAAHAVYEDGKCALSKNLKACKFTTTVNGETESSTVSGIINSGHKCPGGPFKPADDWVVLKLSKPVKSPVNPYRVKAYSAEGLSKDKPVVAVGKSGDFLRGGIVIKHYGDCNVGDVWGNPPFYATTDCDGSHRASGSGLFEKNEDNPVLLGILQGSPDTPEQTREARRTGIRRNGTYDRKNFATGYIPIEGELLQTLQTLQTSPTSAPSKPSPSKPKSPDDGISI